MRIRTFAAALALALLALPAAAQPFAGSTNPRPQAQIGTAPLPLNLNLSGGINTRQGAAAFDLFGAVQNGVNALYAQKGMPNGIAGLDANGLLPVGQLPPIPLTLPNGGSISQLHITGTGSTGDVSGMSVFPDPAAPANSLARMLNGITGCINLEGLGGLGDGVTDNAPAWDRAIAALPARGGCITVPKGRHVSSRTIAIPFSGPNQSIAIIGDGQNSTELTFPASDGFAVTLVDPTTTFHMRDVAVTTGQAAGVDPFSSVPTGRTGVLLTIPGTNGNAALGELCDFTRVTFRGSDGYAKVFGWKIGLALDNVSNVNVDGSTFVGTGISNGTGIAVAGHNDNSLAVVYNIAKSTFLHLNVGVQYGSYVQGMTVSQSNFTAVSNGIYVPPGAAGILSQLTVVGSQFATNPNTGGAAISVQTGVNPLFVSNNLFLSNGPGVQISVGVHSFSSISGNILFSPTPNNNTGITFASGASPSKINDNVIFGFTQGIGIPLSTSNLSVTNNNLVGNTTPLVNGGTPVAANRITGNAGYQPQPPAVQALTGSPYRWESPGIPATACIYGGTVTQVAVDGALVATGPGCFPLEPNENISVAYTAPPVVAIGTR